MFEFRNMDFNNLSALDIVHLVNFSFFVLIYLIFVIKTFVLMIIGLFPFKKFPENKNRTNKYAILIAARNEEKVILNLIDSIRKQTYPQDKLTIFVVADNCHDKTAKLCREAGVVVYERFNKNKVSKGYALQFLVEHIREDYGIESFDGYFLFDADNLLDREFINKMDDAFVSGEKILCSYINVKNAENFISMSYAFHRYRKTRSYNNPRTKLGTSTTVIGTGTLFASEIIAEDGWKWLKITEDHEFSVDCLLEGYRATFVGEAIIYEEQPTTWKVMGRQRLRWAKGQLMVYGDTIGALFAGLFWKVPKNLTPEEFTRGKYHFSVYDIASYLFPLPLAVFLFSTGIYIAEFIIRFTSGESFLAATGLSFKNLMIGYFSWYLLALIQLLPILILEWKKFPTSNGKKIGYYFLFPFFDVLGLPFTIVALFTRAEWKPIVHDVDYEIDVLEEFFEKEDKRRKSRALKAEKKASKKATQQKQQKNI